MALTLIRLKAHRQREIMSQLTPRKVRILSVPPAPKRPTGMSLKDEVFNEILLEQKAAYQKHKFYYAFIYKQMMSGLESKLSDAVRDIADFLGRDKNKWSVAFDFNNYHIMARFAEEKTIWTLVNKNKPKAENFDCGSLALPFEPESIFFLPDLFSDLNSGED